MSNIAKGKTPRQAVENFLKRKNFTGDVYVHILDFKDGNYTVDIKIIYEKTW